MSKESFFSYFIDEAFMTLKKSVWFAVPVIALLMLVRVGVLSAESNDLILMLLGVVLMLAGLPLSAALRVDELSVQLGHTFPREAVLLLALCIAVANICIILGVRGALKKPGQEVRND
jgi:hypothetical protein